RWPSPPRRRNSRDLQRLISPPGSAPAGLFVCACGNRQSLPLCAPRNPSPAEPSMSLLTLEKRGHIAVLTLNRPDSMNALGAPGDGDQVRETCDAVNADKDIRAVVLTGAGRAFSAGGDVKAM